MLTVILGLGRLDLKHLVNRYAQENTFTDICIVHIR